MLSTWMQLLTYLHCPNRLLQRMEEFETKAILFWWTLNDFTGIQKDGSYPLTVFLGFIDQKHSRFQHTPQLGPALEGTTNLGMITENMSIFFPFYSVKYKQNHDKWDVIIWNFHNVNTSDVTHTFLTFLSLL